MTERRRASDRATRCASAAIALLACLAQGDTLSARPASATPDASPITDITVTARRIANFKSIPFTGTGAGKLEFRGGLVLSSTAKEFGGLSGIVLEPDGRRFMAVSDEGTWLSGELTYDGAAPSGIRATRMAPIKALRGRKLDRKRDLDAEAMTLIDGTLDHGTLMVGFERNHRIGIFPVVKGELQPPTRYLTNPPEARRMRSNSGFEAVAVLHGGPMKGAIIAFAERFPGDTSQHAGWIWLKDKPHRLSLSDIRGFDVTDATSLADGTLLILERRFRWTEGVQMRIRSIAAKDIRPGARMQGETLLEADYSSEIDNMEGLAAHRGPTGETVLTVISDNNFNTFLQKTLLLQFTLR
jgi:hypothetical protein